MIVTAREVISVWVHGVRSLPGACRYGCAAAPTIIWNMARSPNVWAFAALCGAFWLLALATEYRPLNVFLQCTTLAVSVAVMFAYAAPGLEALQKREIDREDHLVLGICLAWLGVFLRSGFIILWRVGWLWGNPHSTIDSHWVNLFNFMILLGGVLHITAPGAMNNRIPPRNLALLGAAFGAGAGLASLLLVFVANGI